MNMSFYSAAVGAYQQQLRMNIQANNIANVNTQGFRAEKVTFGELMNRDVVGINNANLPKGTGARVIQATVDFANNRGYIETNMPYDFAIAGNGFFALFDPSNGEVSYTRDGSFMKAQFWIQPDGVDENGQPVLDGQGNPKTQSVTGVYCLWGDTARLKPVEVLWQEDEYILVAPDEEALSAFTSERAREGRRLRAGDQVITAAAEVYDGKVVQ